MNEIQSNFKQYDLDDDDIRILGSEPRRSRRWPVVAVIAALAVAAAVVLWLVLKPEEEAPVADSTPAQEIPSPQKAGCLITDTVLGENSIRIIVPSGTPQLRVGALSPESDSTIVLAAEAAFYRKDNGQISGAYILKGDQLSRGYSSLGYCAIINGKISLGNAKSTSLFEEATETEGYFFRQKPLVDNSKAVYEENSRRNPKQKSQRRALAMKDGVAMVVLCDTPIVLNEFADLLCQLGVEQAIGLSGSISFGFARDFDNNTLYWGMQNSTNAEGTNFIVWVK